jgi:hypothetical protein
MLKKRESIDRLRIAAPCPMSWERMRGDERARFCEQCKLHVYNISELTTREVTTLITKTEGRICGRLYRRADGTVLTKDCPVGLRAIRRRVSRIAGATITAVLSFCFGVLGQSRAQEDKICENGERVRISRQIKTFEQENLPPLTGLVKDLNGAVVVGASVEIVNQQTKEKFAAITNDEGVFNFAALEAGAYQVEVVVAGFRPLRFAELHIYTGELIDLDITLYSDIGSTVIVGIMISSDEDFMPDTSGPGLKTTFSPNKITKLPF